MTRTWLIILRIICAIQLVITLYISFFLVAALFTGGGFIYLFEAIAFAFIATLPIRVFIVLNNNYPDKIIEGKEKRGFNRVFLINILLIVFLAGFVIRDYKDAVYLSNIFRLFSYKYNTFRLGRPSNALGSLLFDYVRCSIDLI